MSDAGKLIQQIHSKRRYRLILIRSPAADPHVAAVLVALSAVPRISSSATVAFVRADQRLFPSCAESRAASAALRALCAAPESVFLRLTSWSSCSGFRRKDPANLGAVAGFLAITPFVTSLVSARLASNQSWRYATIEGRCLHDRPLYVPFVFSPDRWTVLELPNRWAPGRATASSGLVTRRSVSGSSIPASNTLVLRTCRDSGSRSPRIRTLRSAFGFKSPNSPWSRQPKWKSRTETIRIG